MGRDLYYHVSYYNENIFIREDWKSIERFLITLCQSLPNYADIWNSAWLLPIRLLEYVYVTKRIRSSLQKFYAIIMNFWIVMVHPYAVWEPISSPSNSFHFLFRLPWTWHVIENCGLWFLEKVKDAYIVHFLQLLVESGLFITSFCTCYFCGFMFFVCDYFPV